MVVIFDWHDPLSVVIHPKRIRMKRIIAGLALGASTLVTVAPAQAAPINPVKALEKQLSPGHGVRFFTSTRNVTNPSAISRTSGTLEFGKSGIIAADRSTRFHRAKGMKQSAWDEYASLTPKRELVHGGYLYGRGGDVDAYLPTDKKWIRYRLGYGARSPQEVDTFRVKQLKRLVADAKYVKGAYRGSTTWTELRELNGEEGIDGDVGKTRIDYLLDTDSKGLVRRLVSKWTIRVGGGRPDVFLTETRFTGWGAKVAIKAPPESEWIDAKNIADTPQDPADNSIDLLGQNR
jgi:hypothetical protein